MSKKAKGGVGLGTILLSGNQKALATWGLMYSDK